MSLKSAIIKLFARSANDRVTAYDVKMSQERAYKKTDKQINEQKEKGVILTVRKRTKRTTKALNPRQSRKGAPERNLSMIYNCNKYKEENYATLFKPGRQFQR